jgi:hypothetical protein
MAAYTPNLSDGSKVSYIKKDLQAFESEYKKMHLYLHGGINKPTALKSIVPKPINYGNDQYNQLICAAYVLNFVGKTYDTYTGVVFEQEHSLLNFESLEEDYAFDDLKEQVSDLAKESVDWTMEQARGCVLAMPPRNEGGGIMTADQIANDPPTMEFFNSESIINWRKDERGNLTLLVIRQEIETVADQSRPYLAENEMYYRRFALTDDGVEYAVLDKDDNFKEGFEPRILTWADGSPVDYIPAEPIGARRNDWTPEPPPLSSIAHANDALIATIAKEQEDNLMTSHGTLVIAGITTNEKAAYKEQTGVELMTGVRHAIALESPGATVSLLSSNNGSFFTDKVNAQIDRLQDLGAIIDRKSGVGAESLVTIRLRKKTEIVNLNKLVSNVEQAINQSLKTFIKFLTPNEPDEMPSLAMSKEFYKSGIDPEEFRVKLDAWEKGVLSDAMIVKYLKEARAIPNEIDDEEAIKEIASIAAKRKSEAMQIMQQTQNSETGNDGD